jgi:hypothetical protein
MALPDEAVVMFAGVASVYLIDEKGEVRQRNVVLGETEGKYHEVISGLEGNEKIAASNVNLLVSGMTVSVKCPSPSSYWACFHTAISGST